MMKMRAIPRLLHKAIRQPRYALTTGFRRAMANGCYYIGKGRSALPEAVTLYVTHSCNLRCHMCGQWGDAGTRRNADAETLREELSWERMRALIDELACFRPAITLFGGEPLLYPQCLALIRSIKERRMHCIMITNGTLLEDHAEKLALSGLDELNVSIDGKGRVHDEIRGADGAYGRIMRGLARVRSYRAAAGARGPLINIQCTINKLNYERLEEMADVAAEAAADSLTFHNLIFLSQEQIELQKAIDGRLGSASCDWEGFVTDPGIDPGIVSDQIARLRRRARPFRIDLYPNLSRTELRSYYNDPCFVPREGPRRCLSPWLVAYVFPDGDVRPCLNSSYSFGNIGAGRFSRIWNSPAAVRFRGVLQQKRIFPACVRCTELYRY